MTTNEIADRTRETVRRGYVVRERTGRTEPNANGYFVIAPSGARVSGPHETMSQAWDAAIEHSTTHSA